MKKSIALFLLAVFCMALFAGCAKEEPTAPPAQTGQPTTGTEIPAPEAPAEIMEVRFVLPKADDPELEKVTAAINEKLIADGVPVKFVPLNVPQNVYNDRINVMFAGQEEFELLHVMENVTPFTVYLNNEYIVPIEDLLAQYGGNILKALPDEADWNGSKIGEHTYTIPSYWKDVTKSSESGAMGFRGDLLDKYGLKIPTTADELFDTARELKEKWGDKDAFLWICNANNAPVRLLRDTPRYPFTVEYSTELAMYFQDGTFEPYLESEEFKFVANWMKKAYDANLIHPDVLTISNSERDKIVNEGVSLGGNLGPYQHEKRLRENGKVPEYRYELAYLNPEVPAIDAMSALNTNAVSSTSPNPEAGIMFLNWLYADQANFDLLLCGIEGEHYTVTDSGDFKFITKEDGNNLYTFQPWQVAQAEFRRFDADSHEKWAWFQTEPWDNVETSVAKGFVFDPTPVQAQFQAVVAELPATIYPIKMGVQDYDTHFDAALAKLKSIGYDDVIAEYQKQFEAFYNAHK